MVHQRYQLQVLYQGKHCLPIPVAAAAFCHCCQALSEVLPSVAAKKTEKGGYMILRPDSGDPLDAVLAALRAAEKVFGADVNKKGYKVPRGCGVIQGDGIDYSTLSRLLDGIIDAGYSIEVTFLYSAIRSCQGRHASNYVHWLNLTDTHPGFPSFNHQIARRFRLSL